MTNEAKQGSSRSVVWKRLRSVVIAAIRAQESYAVADQVFVSAANFVTTLLMARGSSTEEFGWFALASTLLLLATVPQNSLVLLPHNVLGANRQGSEYTRYTASTALSQVLVGLVGVVLSIAAWLCALLIGSAQAPLFFALIPLVFTWQLNEFARRALYTEQRVVAALTNDIVVHGSRMAVIALFWWNGSLSALLALYVLTVTSMMGAVMGAWQLRRSLSSRVDFSAFRENWDFGKWLLATDLIGTWLSSQLYIYLAACMLGVGAVGTLKALEVVFGPLRMLVMALSNILPTRFSQTLQQQGHSALNRHFRKTLTFVLPLCGGYCLLIALFAQPVLWVFFKDKYTGASSLLALYAVYALFSSVSSFLGAVLRAKRLTRQVFVDRVMASLYSIPLGCLMIYAFGLYGAVLGMIGTYFCVSVLHWLSYQQDDRNASITRDALAPEVGKLLRANDTGSERHELHKRLYEQSAIQVMRRLTGSTTDDVWSFQCLRRGRNARTLLARRNDGQPIWRHHSQLVVKIYDEKVPENKRAAQAQHNHLNHIGLLLNGQRVHGWDVHAPVPLLMSEEPLAVVMTAVPGRPLRGVLHSASAAGVADLQSTSVVISTALRRFWEEEACVYGDLHFENILCDFEARAISFIDPGPPKEPWYEDGAAWNSCSASRDLGYLLWDVISSFSLRTPRGIRREKELAGRIVLSFLEASKSGGTKRQLLHEIRSCVGNHLALGWSPRDVACRLLRWYASRITTRLLRNADSDADGDDVGQRQHNFEATTTVLAGN